MMKGEERIYKIVLTNGRLIHAKHAEIEIVWISKQHVSTDDSAPTSRFGIQSSTCALALLCILKLCRRDMSHNSLS
jgi:hypothetical protein